MWLVGLLSSCFRLVSLCRYAGAFIRRSGLTAVLSPRGLPFPGCWRRQLGCPFRLRSFKAMHPVSAVPLYRVCSLPGQPTLAPRDDTYGKVEEFIGLTPSPSRSWLRNHRAMHVMSMLAMLAAAAVMAMMLPGPLRLGSGAVCSAIHGHGAPQCALSGALRWAPRAHVGTEVAPTGLTTPSSATTSTYSSSAPTSYSYT